MIDPTHLILEFLGIFKSDEILQNFRKRTPKFQKCPHGRRNFCHPKNLGGDRNFDDFSTKNSNKCWFLVSFVDLSQFSIFFSSNFVPFLGLRGRNFYGYKRLVVRKGKNFFKKIFFHISSLIPPSFIKIGPVVFEIDRGGRSL